jgi:hypothetical protein
MLSKGSLLGESNAVIPKHLRFHAPSDPDEQFAREAFKVRRTTLVHASDRFFVAGRD